MQAQSRGAHDSEPTDEREVRSLYQELLACWNDRSAPGFAALFANDGNLVGFDGTTVDGAAEIESHLRQIFADHMTAAFVAKVRGVRFLAPDVALLRAVAGMVPPGKSDLNPAANTNHTVVAVKHNGRWRIALFQNTPAAFHGRPELTENLTRELREVLQSHPPSSR